MIIIFDKIFMIDLIFLFLYIFTRPLELFFTFIYDSSMQFCVYVCMCVKYTILKTDYTRIHLTQLVTKVLTPFTYI